MKKREIKFRSLSNNYSVIIGNNILGYLNKRIKLLCPKTKKVAVIFDKNVPQKFRTILKKELKNYHLIFFSFNSSEKSKNFNTINFFLNKLVINSFNRSDLLIGLGGGITGDVVIHDRMQTAGYENYIVRDCVTYHFVRGESKDIQ